MIVIMKKQFVLWELHENGDVRGILVPTREYDVELGENPSDNNTNQCYILTNPEKIEGFTGKKIFFDKEWSKQTEQRFMEIM